MRWTFNFYTYGFYIWSLQQIGNFRSPSGKKETTSIWHWVPITYPNSLEKTCSTYPTPNLEHIPHAQHRNFNSILLFVHIMCWNLLQMLKYIPRITYKWSGHWKVCKMLKKVKRNSDRRNLPSTFRTVLKCLRKIKDVQTSGLYVQHPNWYLRSVEPLQRVLIASVV